MNVHEQHGGEHPKLRWYGAAEIVGGKAQILERGEAAELRRHGAAQVVAVKPQARQGGQLPELWRHGASQVVVVKVQAPLNLAVSFPSCSGTVPLNLFFGQLTDTPARGSRAAGAGCRSGCCREFQGPQRGK